MSQTNEFQAWLSKTAAETRAEDVPEWPREATFRASREARLAWWQRPLLPLASFACSMLAVIAVVTQLQVQVTEQGFNVRFGSGLDEQQLQAAVDEQMAILTAKQQLQLANYAENLRQDFSTDLAAANQQLVSYVLTTNRTERQQDMEDLIRYVNAQREDDQVYLAHQLAQVTDELFEQDNVNDYPTYQNQE